MKNGKILAAVVAGGVGCASLGMLTVVSTASPRAAKALTWFEPVGPLSGKGLASCCAFLAVWSILYLAWRDKDVNFTRTQICTVFLISLGLAGTYPPIFRLFKAK